MNKQTNDFYWINGPSVYNCLFNFFHILKHIIGHHFVCIIKNIAVRFSKTLNFKHISIQSITKSIWAYPSSLIMGLWLITLTSKTDIPHRRRSGKYTVSIFAFLAIAWAKHHIISQAWTTNEKDDKDAWNVVGVTIFILANNFLDEPILDRRGSYTHERHSFMRCYP